MAALAGACTFPKPADVDGPPIDAAIDAGPAYRVGGTVTGMWTGARVALQLATALDAPQLLTVEASGDFTFPTAVPAGRSFTVSIADNGQPFMHACVVPNGAGTVTDADVLDLRVDCSLEAAVSVSLSAPINLPFDPDIVDHHVEAALGVQETRLVVSAPAATHIDVNGVTALDGRPTQPYPLAFDDTTLDVTVQIGALSRTFAITITRTATLLVTLPATVYGKASNTGSGDELGAAMAGDGRLLVVGAPSEDSAGVGVDANQSSDSSPDAGAVYVFRRSGLAWVQEAYLKPTLNAPGDHFGASVAVEESFGDETQAVLVVGAPGDDVGATDSGAAYVFRRTSSGWRQEQRIKPASPRTGAAFGTSVDVSGDVLAIGAPFEPGAVASAGAVHVYRAAGAVWSPEQVLTAPDPDTGDQFGAAVAIARRLVAVGAPFEDSRGVGVNSGFESDDSAPDSGAVFLYQRDVSSWSRAAYVKASNAGAGDRFGAAVDLVNDGAKTAGLLAVGASGEDGDGVSPTSNSVVDAGAAYVFRGTGASWQQEAYVKGHAVPDNTLGARIAIRGDLLLAGSRSTLPQVNARGAQVFLRDAVGWNLAEGIASPNFGDNDQFGAGLALTGQGLVVGAPHEDGSGTGFTGSQADDSAADSGAWYAFY